MQDRFFSLFLQAISENRLDPYRQKDDSEPGVTCYARYLWNIALCESFYPAIHGLEVTLRNSIHRAITKEIGKEDWFHEILTEEELRMVSEIKDRLISQKKPLETPQIVASSNFGFWVSLFNTRYENILWPKLLRETFPYMPNRNRTRKNVSRRLNRVRELRNRIFHHEPIWRRKNLVQNHDDILETIGWINPSMLSMVKELDRFSQVYNQGVQGYQGLILDYIASQQNE